MRQLKIFKSITNRESISLERYLQEISKYPMITAEEEIELAQRIHRGDKEAVENLVRANLRFVVSVAKQYQNQGLSLSDLINEGNIGLLKATERFDETKGFKFISYAVWWIRQNILQALADKSRVVRLPLNQVGVLNQIYRSSNKLSQENERTPSIEELANDLDLSPEKIRDTLQTSNKHISVDAPMDEEEDGNNLLERMMSNASTSADNELLQESLKIEIERALSTFPERQQKVVMMYYGINRREMSLEEISNILNISRERVRQLRDKTLNQLRKNSKSKNLRAFLE